MEREEDSPQCLSTAGRSPAHSCRNPSLFTATQKDKLSSLLSHPPSLTQADCGPDGSVSRLTTQLSAHLQPRLHDIQWKRNCSRRNIVSGTASRERALPVSATVAADMVSRYFNTNESLSLEDAAISPTSALRRRGCAGRNVVGDSVQNGLTGAILRMRNKRPRIASRESGRWGDLLGH